MFHLSCNLLFDLACHVPVVIQNVLSRPSIFDGTMGMSLLDDLVGLRPPQLWINVQVNMISWLAVVSTVFGISDSRSSMFSFNLTMLLLIAVRTFSFVVWPVLPRSQIKYRRVYII